MECDQPVLGLRQISLGRPMDQWERDEAEETNWGSQGLWQSRGEKCEEGVMVRTGGGLGEAVFLGAKGG